MRSTVLLLLVCVAMAAAGEAPPPADARLAQVRAALAAKDDLNVFAVGKQHDGPLHVAVQAGEAALVEELLKAGADPNRKNDLGVTPIFLARSATIAKALLAAGANAVALDESGGQAIHGAAGTGQAEVVRLLVKAGADVNARDGLEMTPLHWAKGLVTVKTLLELGAERNARASTGETPLATHAHDKEVTDYLIKQGCSR